MEQKEIAITAGMRGKIVYAKRKWGTAVNWVILIADVKEVKCIKGAEHIVYRYVSQTDYFENYRKASKNKVDWGNVEDYHFFEPTDEQVKLVKDILRENNLKYVKGANIVIDR